MVLCLAARIGCSVRAESVSWTMMLGALALVSGCGKGSDAARLQHEAQAAAHTGAGAAAAASAADADMVSAVSPGASGTPVSLRFRQIDPQCLTDLRRIAQAESQALRVDLALMQAPGL